MLATRLPIATGWGGFLSLVMFWVLWTLINAPINVAPGDNATRIEFTRQIIDSVVAPKRREKPELVPPQAAPGVPGVPAVPVRKKPPVAARPDRGPVIKISGPPGVGGISGGSDHDVIPLVRVKPEYPPPLLRRGVEGWVKVQFSITATGMVRDVMVVDSDPANAFDEATIEAVRRWRYSPKIEDGIAVERVGLQTVLVFELQE